MKPNCILALISSIGFILFHLLVDSHYRPNADDFAGMYYASKGLPGIGYATRFYLEWEGPYLSMIVQGLWMRALYDGVSGGLIITLIKLMLLLSSIFAYSGLQKLLNGKANYSNATIAASVTVMVLYLISSSKEDIWHWVMGTVVYVHPQIALMLTLGFLFRKKFVLALLPLAYIMQSRATYAVLFLGLVSLITAYSFITKKEWSTNAIFANIFLLGCFCVYLFAPGNANRMSSNDFDFAHYLYEYKKEIKNVIVSYNIAKLDRVVLGVLAIIPLLPVKTTPFKKNKVWWFTLPMLAYVGFILVHGLVFVYATGYGAWPRVFSMHSLLFFILCCFYGFLMFTEFVPRRVKQRIINVVPALAVGLVMFFTYKPFVSQLQQGKKFSEAYDARTERINSYEPNNASDTLFLKPLPDSGVLHFWDLSEDPSFWINDDFRMRYQIEYEIALRPQNE